MIIKLYEENTNQRDLETVLEVIRKDGVVIFPTDTVYGIGCDIYNTKAVERVARLKGLNIKKADFSFIVADLSNLSEYTQQVDNQTFKLLKKNLPGPFTFILPASSKVPKLFKNNKKTVGLRIPDHPILHTIVKTYGSPLLTTSVIDDDDVLEYTTDPELIHEKYKDIVDLVIDGGYGKNVASTVVNCTGSEPEIIRQGVGELIY